MRRIAVIIFLALFALNTVFVYELVQHARLGAVSLALMATQPPPPRRAAPSQQPQLRMTSCEVR